MYMARSRRRPPRDVWEEIERVREQLVQRWQQTQDLRDPVVLRLSRRLDWLLVRALTQPKPPAGQAHEEPPDQG